MNKQETRLFYVVDSIDKNEEIFETLEKAEEYYLKNINEDEPQRVYIAFVKNAYYEEDLKEWNYEDFSDTFTIIKFLSYNFTDKYWIMIDGDCAIKI